MQKVALSFTILLALYVPNSIGIAFRQMQSQFPSRTEQAIVLDLTTSDVLQVKNWVGTEVLVLGMKVGMSRDQVEVALQRQSLALNDRLDKCIDRPCLVMKDPTTPYGVDLQFNHNVVLKSIGISPWQGQGRPPAGYITTRLVGSTGALVTHYSDELRLKVLHREDERWQEVHERINSFLAVRDTYIYDRGIVIRTSRYRAGGAGTVPPPILERIEFTSETTR